MGPGGYQHRPGRRQHQRRLPRRRCRRGGAAGRALLDRQGGQRRRRLMAAGADQPEQVRRRAERAGAVRFQHRQLHARGRPVHDRRVPHRGSRLGRDDLRRRLLQYRRSIVRVRPGVRPGNAQRGGHGRPGPGMVPDRRRQQGGPVRVRQGLQLLGRADLHRRYGRQRQLLADSFRRSCPRGIGDQPANPVWEPRRLCAAGRRTRLPGQGGGRPAGPAADDFQGDAGRGCPGHRLPRQRPGAFGR